MISETMTAKMMRHVDKVLSDNVGINKPSSLCVAAPMIGRARQHLIRRQLRRKCQHQRRHQSQRYLRWRRQVFQLRPLRSRLLAQRLYRHHSRAPQRSCLAESARTRRCFTKMLFLYVKTMASDCARWMSWREMCVPVRQGVERINQTNSAGPTHHAVTAAIKLTG